MALSPRVQETHCYSKIHEMACRELACLRSLLGSRIDHRDEFSLDHPFGWPNRRAYSKALYYRSSLLPFFSCLVVPLLPLPVRDSPYSPLVYIFYCIYYYWRFTIRPLGPWSSIGPKRCRGRLCRRIF